MRIDYKVIGKNIRTARKRLTLTQEKLGELAGVEPTNISHIERGATKVSLPTLVSIVNVLGIALDEAMYGNIRNDSAVSSRMINDLIADCTPEELRALTAILASAKSAIREYKR